MIVDTHTHFYDPSRPQGVPWPRPTETVLYKTVLPEHYKAVAKPWGVTGTVVVEASPWVEDNQWILDLAAHDPFIVGHVGNLALGSEDFVANLARFARNPLFRGIRTGLPAGFDPAQPRILANLERLVDNDLELDIGGGAVNLELVAQIARRVPALRMVICHVAGVRIDGRAPDPAWLAGMRQVAQYPNVYCKVSGLAENTRQKPAPTDLAHYLPTLDALWEILGEDRLIYGSNWPVCLLFADYATVQRLLTEYVITKGPQAQEKLFWRNAQAAYKWVQRS